jgi:predicted deacylase
MENKKRSWLKVPGTDCAIPLTVIDGAADGKTVFISAGVHSRECVGIEAARRLAQRLEPKKLSGRVVIAHSCNYEGFVSHSDDMVPGDGKNLNKCFPGNIKGSVSERIAACITENLIKECDFAVDLHSGGGHEFLAPHAYFQCTAAPEVVEKSVAMAAHANMKYAVGADGVSGLYSSASLLGKPAVLVERGQCGLWTEEESEQAVTDAKNILRFLDVLRDGVAAVRYPQEVAKNGYYETSPAAGCWYPVKKPGECITAGECVGTIRDVYGELLAEIRAKASGVVLFETSSLAIGLDEPMIAYGEL